MSVKAVFVLVILGLVAWAQPGHAEKVKANQPTKVFSRAGEQSPVVIKVKVGQIMTVINTDGRWLKVRVSGRTGWVPRSKVDAQESDDLARNTRRRPFVDGRSTSRGFGGETGPDDRVGADATGATAADDDKDDKDTGKSSKPSKPDRSDKADRDEPKRSSKPAPASSKGSAKPAAKDAKDDDDDDNVVVDDDDDKGGGGDGEGKAGGDGEKEPARPMAHVAKKTAAHEKPDADSDEAFTIGQDLALYVGKSQGDWTRVSTDEGDAGWVLTSKLDIEQPEGGGGSHDLQINARGRLGVNFVKQSLSTPGGMQIPPDNYSASSPTVAISLGGTVLYPYSKRYVLGGDLGYDFNKAVSGIAFMGQTTGFTYHNFNLRALGGYDLQKPSGMVVFARLGFHFDSFQVDNVGDFTKNTAKLPNQIIEAPTLGVGLAIPRLTPKIGLNVAVDTIIVGASVDQTKNLEDGTGPSAKALFLGASLTYHWKPNMDLQAGYDLDYTTISFSGLPPATSMRGHTGTSPSSGTDFNNALSFGILYGF